MGGGGERTVTTNSADLAPELKPLFQQSAGRVMGLQDAAPLQPFLQSSPLQIAGLSPIQQQAVARTPRLFDLQDQTQQYAGVKPLQIADLSPTQRAAIGQVGNVYETAGKRVTGETLRDSPAIAAARDTFRSSAVPNIVDQLTLSGLGRSTAVPNAIARAEAEFLLPVIQSELGREENAIARDAQIRLAGIGQGLQAGDVERSVGQQRNEAEYQDFLRRQGLALDAPAREAQTIQTAATIGDLERDIQQQRYAAGQEDELRRQALAETALFQPFGQLVPSGLVNRGTSRSAGQGLFK